MPATLKELGQQLREAREGRKLSMQEASEITKISKRILTAFEQADMDQFPHPVYAKGFIKNYAKLLGLDAEEFGRAMGQALGSDESWDRPQGEIELACETARIRPDKSERRRAWPTVLLLLLLVALLAALVWYLLIRPADTTAPEHASAEAVQDVPSPEPEQVAEAVQAEQPATTPATTPTTTVVEAGADAGQGDAGQPASQAEAQTGDQAAPLADKNLLRIRPRDTEGSWVGIYDLSGETLLRDFAVNGQGEMTLVLTDPRSLRIGRVQGVEVWFGGRALELEGVGTRNVTLSPSP